MPETIIGVVAHNNEEVLDPCLRSLHAFTSPYPEVDYIFFDNGSDDETLPMMQRFIMSHRGHLMHSAENQGCNQGWNQIFERAKEYNPNPKYLILINSDVQILRPMWDRELIQTIEESDPMTATCEALGVLHYPGGNLQHVGSAAICYRFDALFELWAEEEDRHSQTGPWDVENFPGWEGDLDLFNALRKRGYWPSLAKQGVQVLHLCGATECALRQGEEFERYQREAQHILAQKWADTPYRKEWWGKRMELGAIETLLEYTDDRGHPHFRDGVNEVAVREVYPWL
ncbi:MAG: glycosyltransferase [Planctomycetota bacterium]|jgi:glycosyltransferase involved in cell wall biosynthesis